MAGTKNDTTARRGEAGRGWSRRGKAGTRYAQQEYFRTRSQSAMDIARRAERRVDKLMAEMCEPQLF
jgi:hypothetical protein